MVTANTKPLSGMRDFLPRDVLRRRYAVDIIERVYQSHGFEPLETPAMERLETLLGKYGEEGDQLIFRILKRGEKLARALEGHPDRDELCDAGLRYDLTVPLARVASEYRSQLPRFLKRYQVQPVYRADRPAKGRFREFFQCDLDIVGSQSPVVEAEVLSAAATVFHRLGFEGKDFTIRLNHRQALRALLRRSSIPESLEETALVALDKLDKVGAGGVREELEQRGIPADGVDRLLASVEQVPEGSAEAIEWLRGLFGSSDGGRVCDDLASIVKLCSYGTAADHLLVDPFLARGLSYYTGPIFEVQCHGFAGSAGGGGRYDDLIGMFGGQRVPACGFSLGLERILLIMEEKGLFPDRLAGEAEVLITLFSDETTKATLKLASELRSEGVKVDVYPEADRYGKQFKYAEQRGIRFVLLLSPREIEAEVVAAKDLETGRQVDVDRGSLREWLRERL